MPSWNVWAEVRFGRFLADGYEVAARVASALISPHELDVALAFDNVEAAGGLNGAGTEAHPLSRLIRATWSAFVHEGRPACTTGVPKWPEQEALGRAVAVLDSPRGVEVGVVADADGMCCPSSLRCPVET